MCAPRAACSALQDDVSSCSAISVNQVVGHPEFRTTHLYSTHVCTRAACSALRDDISFKLTYFLGRIGAISANQVVGHSESLLSVTAHNQQDQLEDEVAGGGGGWGGGGGGGGWGRLGSLSGKSPGVLPRNGSSTRRKRSSSVKHVSSGQHTKWG